MDRDLPLHELREYGGKSPKPDDFDEYWARALQELDRQSLDYELVPAEMYSPAAECFHLYFTGVGGARVHAKYVRPRHLAQPGPGVAMFHGYACDSGDWSEKILYAASGVSVLALDCRGQGGPSEDVLRTSGPTLRGHVIRGLEDANPDNLYYRNVFLDTVQTARILMSLPNVDETRIAALGYSQGGALTVACAALEPRIALAIPVYPFLSDYRRAWEMEVVSSAYEELSYYFRWFDPQHKRAEETFRRLGYIDIQHLASRIRARVIWVTGLTDTVCPPSTQFAAYNKIAADKEMLLLYEHGHEWLPGVGDRALSEITSL
ncbi:alpha/beta fold hydrolase [Saccharibacillus deserti]|uniref:alpha/beta fold hydrolase n=1 Tax=Saccharibacillus deserti TaxID=1634444 RepID=UPI001552EC32|nr:alpha/beta fold hydrolase [Saccharibacillus deserti]